MRWVQFLLEIIGARDSKRLDGEMLDVHSEEIGSTINPPASDEPVSSVGQTDPGVVPIPKELDDGYVLPKFSPTAELLKMLHKCELNWVRYIKQRFEEKLENFDSEFNALIEGDLIRPATLSEIADKKYTIKNIAPRLKANGLKVSGKKAELVQRLLPVLDASDIRDLERMAFYLQTNKGKALVEADYKRLQSEIIHFEGDVYRLLIDKKIERAFRLVASFYASTPYQIGMGTSWEDGFDKRLKRELRHLLSTDFLLNTSNLTLEEKEAFRCTIVAHRLFEIGGFEGHPLTDKILQIKPDFQCKSVKDFLSCSPTGIFSDYNYENKKDLIEIVYHTLVSEAFNSIELKESLSGATREYAKGIAILPGNEKCKVCKGLEKRYRWSKIDNLPQLPRYPGCVCTYQPIV